MNKKWLSAIKNEIVNKYKISNPSFIIKEKNISKKNLLNWIKENLVLPHLWIRYKKMGSKSFELQSRLSKSKTKICIKIIKNYLKILLDQLNQPSFFTISFIDEITKAKYNGSTLYTNQQIIKELLYLFRLGYSKIVFDKEPTKENNRIIYHLRVDQDSLENMLNTGYLNLEYK